MNHRRLALATVAAVLAAVLADVCASAATAAPPGADGATAAARRPQPVRDPWVRNLVLDWVSRGVNVALDGEPAPKDGLLPNGRLESGGHVRRIVLERPPAGSADMPTTTAFLDMRGARYWVNESGGIFYRVHWVGPFALKRPRR